jgi:transcriptional regulator with XRE-family HTH domain
MRDKELLRLIGRNIKKYRGKRGLTQEEAANSSGIEYKRWQKLEAGSVNFTIYTLNRIATILKVAPKQLMES